VKAAVPANEFERLAALDRYEILDSDAEPAFDRITAIAARTLGVPMAMVSLIDAERQWFKSRVGLADSQTSRDIAFCAHAILHDEPMVVPDAHRDTRFHNNPLVQGAPHIRFYAGAPLQSPDGFNLGTLCALDTQPREFSAEQIATLRDLAALVVDELELRIALRARNQAQRELSKIEAHLRNHVRMLRGIVDSAAEGIAVVDLQMRPLIINPSGMRTLGLEALPDSVPEWAKISRSIDPITHAPIAVEDLPLARALRGESTDQMEVLLPQRDGRSTVLLSVTGRPLHDDAGQVSAGVITFNDVTALRAAQRQVAELAMTDELTGLPNRRAFRQLLTRLVNEGARGRNFALVIADIDHFKTINDTYGHQIGDEVLVAVADRLATRVRRSDFVGRYGGEEFCVLYCDVDEPSALRLVEELRDCVANVDKPARVTASFGICVSTGQARPAEEVLIANADAALYRAKHAGRNRVCQHHWPQLRAAT
jgi:diguanylate cyclase (GGDEF)-like protein